MSEGEWKQWAERLFLLLDEARDDVCEVLNEAINKYHGYRDAYIANQTDFLARVDTAVEEWNQRAKEGGEG